MKTLILLALVAFAVADVEWDTWKQVRTFAT